jgi:hypothetical protein
MSAHELGVELMGKFSELKAAALAATPGPWISVDDHWSDGDDALISCGSREGMIAIAKIDGGGSASDYNEPFSTEQQANVRYIAAANPAAILALLAELEARDKRIAEAEIRGIEKLAAAFKSWASDCSHIDYDAQRHWATASQEALSFADDLRNGGCDD